MGCLLSWDTTLFPLPCRNRPWSLSFFSPSTLTALPQCTWPWYQRRTDHLWFGWGLWLWPEVNKNVTSSVRLILAVWIWKILCFVLRSGTGNYIFLSILPGRINAGSRVYILFVAMITFTSAWVSNPSSWFSSSSIVRWTSFSPPELESYLFVPIASISSMKIIAGECYCAVLNSYLTSFGPSPRYFWISSDPTTLKKVADVSLATALASNVFPVPGSPYKMTPLGGWIPMSSYISGCVKGSSTASLIYWICVSNPPISA